MPKPSQRISIPELTDLNLVVPGDDPFDELVMRRQDAKEQIEKLNTVIAECDSVLGPTLDLNAIRNVVVRRAVWVGDVKSERAYVVTRREPTTPRKTIDPTKLLELGVSPQVIRAAMKESKPGKPGVVVRRVGETEDDGKPEVDGGW